MTNKNLTKYVLIAALAVTPFVVVPALSPVNAATDNTQSQSILERIMSKFGFSNTDEAKDYVSEQRIQRQSVNQERMITKLDQAVKDGVITEAQKQEILNKSSEFRNKMRSMDPFLMDREARRTMIQEHKEEMQKWAQENGIDLSQYRNFRQGQNDKGNRMGGMGLRDGSGARQGMGYGMGMMNNR